MAIAWILAIIAAIVVAAVGYIWTAGISKRLASGPASGVRPRTRGPSGRKLTPSRRR